MKWRWGILLTSVLLSLAPIGAQRAATLTGTWSVEAAPAEAESPDGAERSSIAAISGTLQLEQKDRAIAGSWQGRMPAPWPLTGTTDGVTFEMQSEVRDVPVIRNGEEQTAPRRWIFKGTIDGDTLNGTMSLSGGDKVSPSQPFTATRAKPKLH